MSNALRDENRVPTMIAVSSSDGVTPVTLYADPTTHRLYVDLPTGTGDVVGPASAGDDALVRFDTTTGKLVQNSGILLDDNNVLYPSTTDAGVLGSTTKMWSDLFLASGAVINFNNGDVTITHTSNQLTIAGGSLALGSNSLALTGSISTTSARATKGWFTDLEITNSPTVNGTAISSTYLALAGGTMTGNLTLGENTAVALDPAGSADEKWSGITCTGTAGATLAVGDLIYLDVTAGEWLLADADAASTSGDVPLGLCILAANDGQATNILLMGTMRSAAFPGSIALGAPVYVGVTAGDIQAAQPTGTDDVIRRVGWAITVEPNTIYFNPSNDYITHT